VVERVELRADGGPWLVDLDAAAWHSLTALEDNSLLVETKQGPFQPVDDNDWADWAPAEGAPAAEAIAGWFTGARTGESFAAFQ
jgi:hypothetical protein